MSNFIPTFPTPTTPIPKFQQLLNNWDALNTIFEKDHTFFTDASATQGHHKQVFYNAPLAAPSPVPTGSQAAEFTRASVAPAVPVGTSQLIYQNTQSALYLLSCVRAWGNVGVAGGGPASLNNGFNASATWVNTGIVQITFTTPLLDNNYAIIATAAGDFLSGCTIGWNNVFNTGFRIQMRGFNGLGTDLGFCFVVLRT